MDHELWKTLENSAHVVASISLQGVIKSEPLTISSIYFYIQSGIYLKLV